MFVASRLRRAAGAARFRLRGAAESAQRRFAPRAVILMYHRVTEREVDPWALCVSPRKFDAHLAALETHFEPIPLRDLARAHEAGRVPAGSVAITFDDGYADTLEVAAPLLERHRLPATFFLTSAALGAPRPFWWDELARLLLPPARLPDRLELTLGKATRSWELGEAAGPYRAPSPGTPAAPPSEAPPDTRLGFFYSVWQSLRPLDAVRREQAIEAIRDWAGGDGRSREDRILTREEARQLAGMPGVEIGAHTVTHPALSSLAPDHQRREIADSKRSLETLLARRVESFAYPYGDYGAETPALVEAAGFAVACTAEPGVVWRRTPTYLLPRLQVEDWEGDELVGRIRRLLR